MFVVMAITIYTSRIILESLGIEDYGIINVVGGIASSFGFFSSSMSNATQRYLSYGHGEGNIDKVKEYFNILSILYFFGACFILIIGGCLGFWIVSKLNIPPQNYWAGIVVYYTTLISLIITIFTSIFDAVLIARERMSFYAYISILDVCLKLGIAYLIFIIPNHKIQIYALLSLLLIIIVKGIQWIYCIKKFPECRFELKWQPEKIKSTMKFIGWNGVGTLVWMINDQGVNVILNLFFGPVVNAARGIANQVNTALNNFTSNFYLALNPQIIKTYAAGKIQECIHMMGTASQFSFVLLWIISLPVILRRNYILHLWLKDVPDYTSIFLFWIIIYSLVNVLTRPQWTVIQAVGNLKQYIINGAITMIGALPIAYVLFKYDFPPQSVFIILVILRTVYVIISLFTIKKFIEFPLKLYTFKVLYPIFLITSISLLCMSYLNKYISQDLLGLTYIIILNIVITGTVSLFILPPYIRTKLFTAVRKRFI